MSKHDEVKPRLLLVEDDAISRGFLLAVLEALPAQVDAVASMSAALALETTHDLWLFDANLADGSGIALLRQLRARQLQSPALAHTADDSHALHMQLLAAGFVEVLVKPLSASRLQQSVRHWLGQTPRPSQAPSPPTVTPPALPLWDDASALTALNGNAEHVSSLRKLFLGELDLQHRNIQAAVRRGDDQGARQELHRLKASSGFVGALRLQAAARRLEKGLQDEPEWEQFSAVLEQTRSPDGNNA